MISNLFIYRVFCDVWVFCEFEYWIADRWVSKWTKLFKMVEPINIIVTSWHWKLLNKGHIMQKSEYSPNHWDNSQSNMSFFTKIDGRNIRHLHKYAEIIYQLSDRMEQVRSIRSMLFTFIQWNHLPIIW
jgi:hypothetical protein